MRVREVTKWARARLLARDVRGLFLFLDSEGRERMVPAGGFVPPRGMITNA
jgi:hypothetical protein